MRGFGSEEDCDGEDCDEEVRSLEEENGAVVEWEAGWSLKEAWDLGVIFGVGGDWIWEWEVVSDSGGESKGWRGSVVVWWCGSSGGSGY